MPATPNPTTDPAISTTASATQQTDVLIVGSGWAGLAAAAELSAQGRQVTVLEAAKQIGGRARSVDDPVAIDNGQHLMIGAYRDLLILLQRFGIDESSVLARHSLLLPIKSLGEQQVTLQAARLPAPLHMLIALLRPNGMTWSERLCALRFCGWLWRHKFQLADDLSLAELLKTHHQPARLIRFMWEPLCLATLNTPVEKASAKLFLTVLRDVFNGSRADADLLIPKTGLSQIFAEPASRYIESHGGEILLRHRVTQILIEDNRVQGVQLQDGHFIRAQQVILATPAKMTQQLLAAHNALGELSQSLGKLTYQPIITLYFQFPPEVQLSHPVIGCAGSVSQWLFDHRHYDRPGLISVVISAEGPQTQWDNSLLVETVMKELRCLIPGCPDAIDTRVLREQRATFSAEPNVDQIRPGNTTPVTGCWLAGDYTNTGYPATLEGAIRSGRQCAQQVLA